MQTGGHGASIQRGSVVNRRKSPNRVATHSRLVLTRIRNHPKVRWNRCVICCHGACTRL
ncbi:hypothetical protein HanRHA438_Chr09g0421221 [Helianthus annuus]|uniref:Uncharacterized protein n=1 Tax=Helianthus annuus TaxID=4232 RepID=A0A251U002_HELAN|nr:hypothetical protein HanIR_Chr09g0441061 [Helianthus annuus]KAJ0890207.1 hypothetical protein HanRHA438_Chr09g0421221 [Helianthus annuus]